MSRTFALANLLFLRSSCIDAGDPTADFSNEPRPNGIRLNIGAHAGTAFAEMSDPPFTGDTNGDGVFDADDYDLFLALWEEPTNPTPWTSDGEFWQKTNCYVFSS